MPQLGHMTGHMTPSPHIIGYMNPHGSFPNSPTPLPTLPPLQLPTTPVPPNTLSSTQTTVSLSPGNRPTESRTDPKLRQSVSRGSVSRGSVSPRRDGRRSVSLSSSDMPRLSEVSSLYGQPTWWGDQEDVTKGDSSRLAHREAQILRDISPPRQRSSSVSDTTQLSQHSSKAVVSVTRGDAQGEVAAKESSNFAWTVEPGQPPRRSRAIPPKWRRNVRSADSSPIRRPGSERQGLSANTTPVRNTASKEFTPLSHRVTATKPPSGSRKTGKRSSPSPVRSSAEQNNSAKQEELISQQEKLKSENYLTSHSTRNTTSSSALSAPVGGVRTSPPPPTEGLRSQSDTGVGSREKADETFVVKSPTEDERPNSARRQWTHEPVQVRSYVLLQMYSVHVADSGDRSLYMYIVYVHPATHTEAAPKLHSS